LRPDLVPGREQEEVEEDRLHEGGNLDVELPDHDTGKQSPDNDAETETAELHASDQKADRERQEDREFGIVPQPMMTKSIARYPEISSFRKSTAVTTRIDDVRSSGIGHEREFTRQR
jgi:hypothetical protein